MCYYVSAESWGSFVKFMACTYLFTAKPAHSRVVRKESLSPSGLHLWGWNSLWAGADWKLNLGHIQQGQATCIYPIYLSVPQFAWYASILIQIASNSASRKKGRFQRQHSSRGPGLLQIITSEKKKWTDQGLLVWCKSIFFCECSNLLAV